MNLRRFFTLFVALMFSLTLIAQNIDSWNYVSPVDESRFINPENTIAFSNEKKLDINSINSSMINVNGSISGKIYGHLELSSDGKTLIFEPEKKFAYGERITATLERGISTTGGELLPEVRTTFLVRGEKSNTFSEETSPLNLHYNSKAPVETIYSYDKLITYGDYALPENMPVPQITAYNNPNDDYVFLGIEPQTDRYTYYAMIIDRFGTPIFYREWPSKTVNLQVSAGDKIIHKNQLSDGFDKNSFLVLNDKYQPIDTLQVGNGYKTNTHDGILLEDGNHFLMIYDSQPVGMDTVVEGGNPNATVKGFIFQELDSDHNVIFQWRSWDHFEITDANNVDLTKNIVDYVHVNAFDTTSDGNFLLCCRHFDEITKVDLTTGDIIWRFGPNAKKNMFTFTNDTIGFTYPHDIQELTNGNITMFDNGNHHETQVSSSVEYELNEENLTASLVWKYTRDPAVYGPTKGGSRKLDNGNRLIGWGSNYPIVATEVNDNKEIEWELNLDSCYSYRATSFNWETSAFETNVDTLDYGFYDGYEPWPVIFQVTNNMEENISITSASHHSEAFALETELPVEIAPGETANMMISFFPEDMGEQDFEDVLTINMDGYFSDTLRQRISRQVKLLGTTVDYSGIGEKYTDDFKVYPNPVTGNAFVIESVSVNIKSFELCDISGRVVKSNYNLSSQNIAVPTDGLAKGMYMLNTIFANGIKGTPRKLMIRY